MVFCLFVDGDVVLIVDKYSAMLTSNLPIYVLLVRCLTTCRSGILIVCLFVLFILLNFIKHNYGYKTRSEKDCNFYR